MKLDDYGEVVNDPDTYERAVAVLTEQGSVLPGWTDEQFTHLDVLFTLSPEKHGNIQRGLHNSRALLFVSVIGFGTFGFDRTGRTGELHESYVGEKLGLGDNVTTTALSALITGIIERLAQ